jgi:hypothetical protein
MAWVCCESGRNEGTLRVTAIKPRIAELLAEIPAGIHHKDGRTDQKRAWKIESALTKQGPGDCYCGDDGSLGAQNGWPE